MVISQYQRLWMVNKMPNTKKSIAVNFVGYEPYEPVPTFTTTIGMATQSQALQLIDALVANHDTAGACCIRQICAEYKNYVSLKRPVLPGVNPSLNQNVSLDLTPIFYYSTKQLCYPSNHRFSDEKRMQRCAKHLRAGKCIDPFIRQSIGAILYPELYTKQK